jgi:hypothetical protein
MEDGGWKIAKAGRGVVGTAQGSGRCVRIEGRNAEAKNAEKRPFS